MKKDIPEGKNYALWHTPQHTHKTFTSLSVEEQLHYLCTLGHLAPSSHNTQPWRFKIDVSSCAIAVFLDRAFVLAVSDPTGRQATISIGCAIENIITAAKYLGFETTFEEHAQQDVTPCSNKTPDTERYVQLATLLFTPAKKQHDTQLANRYKSIFSRKVMRTEYDPTATLPEHVVTELQEASQSFANVGSRLFLTRTDRLFVAELQGQADAYVINLKPFAEELGAWLLPNTSKSGLGMPGYTFGLQAPEAVRLHKGLSGTTPLLPEDGLIFATGGKVAMEKASLIASIHAPHDSSTEWLAAGQLFERMFLILESHNFSVSVHAGIAEVDLINHMFDTHINTPGRTVLLFRAGRVDTTLQATRPHSPRTEIATVLLEQ